MILKKYNRKFILNLKLLMKIIYKIVKKKKKILKNYIKKKHFIRICNKLYM